MAMEVLTQSFVEKIKCPINRQKIEYFDIGRRGLLLEVRISGGKTYYLRYTDFRGKFRSFRIGNALDISLADARFLAEKFRHNMAMGVDPYEDKLERKNAPLFSEFIKERFLPHIMSYKKSWKTDVSLLNNHILPAFGAMHFDEFRREHVQNLHSGMKRKSAKESTCNRLLILVKFIFSQALKWEVSGLRVNPAKDVSFFKANNHKERYLTGDETRRLFNALNESDNPMLRSIVSMLVLTGARKREVLDASWDEIDIERRLWRISMSKSGRARHVPLSDGVLALLQSLPKTRGCNYLFANPDTLKPYQNIFRTWHRARTAAGIADVRIHDLRHNFASLLVNNGRSLYEVQQILGHAQVRTTQRYAHLANETLIAAANVAGVAVQSYTNKEKAYLANVEEKPLSNQMAENGLDSGEKPTVSEPWVMVA